MGTLGGGEEGKERRGAGYKGQEGKVRNGHIWKGTDPLYFEYGYAHGWIGFTGSQTRGALIPI